MPQRLNQRDAAAESLYIQQGPVEETATLESLKEKGEML